MSVQIIERKEGYKNGKITFAGAPQVSFNDYGHLVVRLIVDNQQDTLIVFDAATSANIANFCQGTLRPMSRCSSNDVPYDDDIPF